MTLILKSLIFTLVVPGTVAAVIPLQIASGAIADNVVYLSLGTLFILIGVMIYSWCVWDFVTFGKGTPAPVDAPKLLVVRGLYQYSRNPMYVGVLSIIVGWGIMYTDLMLLVYGLTMLILFQVLVMFYEEPILNQLYGNEYLAYQQMVNRWL